MNAQTQIYLNVSVPIPMLYPCSHTATGTVSICMEAWWEAELQWTITDLQLSSSSFLSSNQDQKIFLSTQCRAEHPNTSIKQWFYPLRRLFAICTYHHTTDMKDVQNISACNRLLVAMATASAARRHAARPSVCLTYRSSTLCRHPDGCGQEGVCATKSNLTNPAVWPSRPGRAAKVMPE